MSKVYITQDSDRTLNDSSRNLDGKSVHDDSSRVVLTTPWLSLRDMSYYPLYFDFQQTQVNYFSVFVLLMYSSVLVFRAVKVVNSYPTALSYFNLFVAIMVVIVAAACCTLRLVYNFSRFRKSISMTFIAFLETLWLFGWNLYCASTVLLSAVNGRCTGEYSFGCSMSKGRLDDDKMLVAMMVSVLMYLVLRSAKWEVVIFSYVMNIAVITACIFYYNLEGSVATFFSFLPFSTLALYEYRRQIMKLFELNLEHTRIMEEAQATELRHMIGNVAHDLKTVSR